MTELSPLQQFAQQLAIWTEAIIEHGRTPFRRVDTYPKIDTELGTISPPVVFWINRQSMMAGGVLFLPENNLKDELARGTNCAKALGLNHFITWETDKVRIWQCANSTPSVQQEFILTYPDQPETFRFLLEDLLEALKLFAVIGATPANKLPTCYFNNLFRLTLQQTLPPLISAYRSQRSEAETPSRENADICAKEANRLILLRLLALTSFGLLPDTILPENLEQTIKTALLGLPEYIQQPLLRPTIIKPPELPLKTAVRLHHLLLRLHQLGWGETDKHAAATIKRLINSWYPPIAPEEKTELTAHLPIQLYPQIPPQTPTTIMVLSGSASFLATTAMLTAASSPHRSQLIFGNIFQFDQDSIPNQSIYARLLNFSGIPNATRHEYSARLRSAWPNRNLKIKTGQPFWRWELIHLIGICHKNQEITLDVPVDLIKSPSNHQAWEMLQERLAIKQIKKLDSNTIKLELVHSPNSGEKIPVKLATELRHISPSTCENCLRSQILLTLTLPSNIYSLLNSEINWFPDETLDSEHLAGLAMYQQSHLYKYLHVFLHQQEYIKKGDETIITNDEWLPIPHPEPLLLKELANNSALTNHVTVDDLLAQLLGNPSVATIVPPDLPKTARVNTATKLHSKKIREDIAQQLNTHGIPNFPDQYLYFLEHPKIIHYSITPPLTIKSSLLGQFELTDDSGQLLSGYGDELEQSLLLCSQLNKTTFELPSDRQQLEQLLSLYKKDLQILYHHLNDLCYRQLQDPKVAQKLIKRIWSQFNLPAKSWFN